MLPRWTLSFERSVTLGRTDRETLLAEAARLRAISRIKLPDAIHAATALQRECTSFLTNDDRLTIPGIKVLGWDDLSKEPT